MDYGRRGQREMRIQSLTLQSFRGFEDATLDLDRPLTVLFGVNGSGKSSVLLAIALVGSRFLLPASPVAEEMWTHRPNDSDVRIGAKAFSITAGLSNGDVKQEVAVGHHRGSAPRKDH